MTAFLLDFNECINDQENNCSPNASCTNGEGTYSCSCKEGFGGNGTHCCEYICLKLIDQ